MIFVKQTAGSIGRHGMGLAHIMAIVIGVSVIVGCATAPQQTSALPTSKPIYREPASRPLHAPSVSSSVPPLEQRMVFGMHPTSPTCGDPRSPSNARRKPASQWSVATTCLNIIRENEGFRATPYTFSGDRLIGYGHLILPGESYDRISRSQAEQILSTDVAEKSKRVAQLIKVEVTQNEFSAFVCLAYNTGTGYLERNSDALKHLNAGQRRAAADKITWVRRANNRISTNLVKRRQRECSLFLTP